MGRGHLLCGPGLTTSAAEIVRRAHGGRQVHRRIPAESNVVTGPLAESKVITESIAKPLAASKVVAEPLAESNGGRRRGSCPMSAVDPVRDETCEQDYLF